MKISYEQLGVKSEMTLIVAVSGGPDSLTLLHILNQEGFKNIIIAHLDHQLRKESQKDAQLVAELAQKYEKPFELKTVDIKAKAQRENLEAVGRTERYQFFRELKHKHKADYIVTAHHADDQIETVLLNIIRGCGLDGLSGMQEVDGDIWRPLLPYSKQDIFDYCKVHQLTFVEDKSNQDLVYRRNFLRHQVIPKLKELNPNLIGTMKNNLRIWKNASDFLLKQAKSYLDEQDLPQQKFRLKSFLELDEVLQALVLRSIFEKVHGHKQNLQQDHLDQVLKILRTNVSGKQKEFGPGKILLRNRYFFKISTSS